MSLPRSVAIAVFAALCTPAVAIGQSTSVVATATVKPRTAVRVSSGILQFVVPPGRHEARDVVDFAAAARTRPDAEVLLVVEIGSVTGPGSGPHGVLGTLAVDGPQGATGLDAEVPATAARWSGGGVRQGTLTFTLRGVAPGTYTAPLRVTVSVP